MVCEFLKQTSSKELSTFGQVKSVTAVTLFWVQVSVTVTFVLLCTIPAETDTSCLQFYSLYNGNPFITVERVWQNMVVHIISFRMQREGI